MVFHASFSSIVASLYFILSLAEIKYNLFLPIFFDNNENF